MTSEARSAGKRDRRSRSNRLTAQSGPVSPPPSAQPDSVFLVIGEISGAHGVRGEVRMAVYTDRPERLPELRRVYFDDNPTPIPLAGVRMQGKHALLRFHDITDRDQATVLRGTIVRIRGDQFPPPEEGAFYHYQVIGLSVFDESGARLGRVFDILETGEVDVYVVRDDRGNDQLFPALSEVVLDIDPENNRMTVRPQQWDDEPA